VHSSGFAVLLNQVGTTNGNPFGYSNTGFNVTIATTGNDIHYYQEFGYGVNGSGQLTNQSGTPWAQDGRDNALDDSSATNLLSSFNTLSATKRSWTLFLADLSSGEQSTLVSWGLEISTVPEPVNVALSGFAALAAIVATTRWVNRKICAQESGTHCSIRETLPCTDGLGAHGSALGLHLARRQRAVSSHGCAQAIPAYYLFAAAARCVQTCGQFDELSGFPTRRERTMRKPIQDELTAMPIHAAQIPVADAEEKALRNVRRGSGDAIILFEARG